MLPEKLRWRLQNIHSPCADVIAATLLLSFATPATDFRVDRRGAIVIVVPKFAQVLRTKQTRSLKSDCRAQSRAEKDEGQSIERYSGSHDMKRNKH